MHRIFYAAGPGNIISAHRYWRLGHQDPTEVSITFSSQVADFCKQTNSPGYFIGYRSPSEVLEEGQFKLEHRPKPLQDAKGLRYHLAQVLYAINLARAAREFRATVAIIESGTSHFFMGWLFRSLGIRVITILHNTLWPKGFPPSKPLPKLIQKLDAAFFRWGSSAIIGVSPECTRQVKLLTKDRHCPLFEMRAQFVADRFAGISQPPAFDGSLLRIMFIGRINRAKGVFDILEMAKHLSDRLPDRVEWEICGTGPDLDALKQLRNGLSLANVHILGWVTLAQLREVYNRSHISIVPTRSEFAEGLAMTAAEAILAGRPILTNPTVPALEILREASLEGKTNEPMSYVLEIERLFQDLKLYPFLCEQCVHLQAQFYDRSRGLNAVLSAALE